MMERMAVIVGLAAAGWLATAPTTQTETPGAGLSAVRREIEAVERELAKVAALEAQVEQLERTVAIMTPLLADRSMALRTGDVTGDGKRDYNDLSVWYCCRGAPASQPASACWFVDMDKSGRVDSADLNLLNAAIKR